MRALYDRKASIIVIDIDVDHVADAVDSIDLAPRATVMLDGHGKPLTLEIVGADYGVEEPIGAALNRWPELDREALVAAARSALSAPDREVSVTLDAAA
ncbi:MAG: hypothetical protein QM679_04720 [Patulibacter sp.]